jgi:hypothetical protein
VTSPTTPGYRERLWPGPWIFVSTALIIPACLLVFLPINQTIGVIVAVAAYAVIVALLVLSTPAIEVTASELIAGRARLPLSLAGRIEGFTKETAQLERGQHLDARAWLLIRGWIDPVVKVEVDDAADPTPYWLLSTRHPEALIAAINDARPRKD